MLGQSLDEKLERNRFRQVSREIAGYKFQRKGMKRLSDYLLSGFLPLERLEAIEHKCEIRREDAFGSKHERNAEFYEKRSVLGIQFIGDQ